jgi:UDP-glucose:(heptosyl)LPS alpha-1,3-glucosyltransferase
MLWFAAAAETLRRKTNYDLSLSLAKTWNQDLLRLSGGPLPVFWRLSQQAYPPGLARRWKMFRRRSAPVNRLIKVIERHQLQSTPHLVAVSDKLVDWVAEAYPDADTSKIKVIYNQPDLGAFRPVDNQGRLLLRQGLGLDPKLTYIGTAGTNFFLKGIGCLIQALALLPQHYHLLVAGGRHAGRWKKLAHKLGVGERVHFLGRVDDMPSFYNCLDVFALTSFYDACSNAVLEALSCKIPTLSTANNGSSIFLEPLDVIDDSRDTRTLATMLKRLAGQGKALDFTWPQQVTSGLEPYKELIERL